MSRAGRYSRLLAFGALVFVECSSPPALDEARAAPLGDIIAQVDQARLSQDVGEFVEAHDTDTPIDCKAAGFADEHRNCHLTRDKARALLRQKLEALGLDVVLQPAGKGVYTTTNVIAERKGKTLPEQIVLVGAHYDAYYSGADDNSSGIAAVLEIARVLSTREFARTLRFVGFDLEELGLVGSTRYVTEGAKDERVVGAIIFDCIGFRATEPGSQQGLPGFAVPTVGDFIAVIGNAGSASLSDDVWLIHQRFGLGKVAGVDAPGRSDSFLGGNLMRSDHAPFWLHDKPALFITDTANFRNPHYHLASDKAETLDPRFLKQVTQLSAAALAYWAGGNP